MNTKTLLIFLALSLSLAAITACGDDDDNTNVEEGTLTVKVYGEEFIEDGIPADQMDDGWAVSFDHFVVSIDQVNVGGVSIPTPDPIDIVGQTSGSGHTLATASVPVGTHDKPSYAITRIKLAGTATKGDVTKAFDFKFEETTHYADCETSTTVEDDANATFEITVHADHLFADSLVSETPRLVFQALADADADDDGNITQAELEAADLGSYDPGSQGGIDNLWAFLSAQSQSVGHVDGEGHCHAHTSPN